MKSSRRCARAEDHGQPGFPCLSFRIVVPGGLAVEASRWSGGKVFRPAGGSGRNSGPQVRDVGGREEEVRDPGEEGEPVGPDGRVVAHDLHPVEEVVDTLP